MSALRLECTCREWWGDLWRDSNPFAVDAAIQTDHGLPNAPVTVYLLTHNAMEAAQLLRLAADRIEREPALLLPLEIESVPKQWTPGQEEYPF